MNATSFRDTTIVSASIAVIARRLREPFANGTEGITGGLEGTLVVGTGVLIVTVGVEDASRLRRTQVGELGQTSGRVTLVVGTLGVGWNRDGSLNASTRRNALVGEALVGLFASGIRLGCEDALVSSKIGRVGRDASVDGASVVVVTVGSSVAIRDDWALVFKNEFTSGRIASVLSTHGLSRNGLKGLDATSEGIARIGVALVGTSAVGSWGNLTEGRARIGSGGKLANIDGTSVLVVTVGSTSGGVALGRTQVLKDGLSSLRVAAVVGAFSVGLDGLVDRGTSSSTRVEGLVARVDLAQVGGIVANANLRNGLTASSSERNSVAHVGVVATIRGNTARASAESAASGTGGVGRALLTSLGDQVVDEGGKKIP